MEQRNKNAAQHIKKDTRNNLMQPLELDPQLRVVSKVGGLMIFGGADALNRTLTGRTRFSIDFRTVHLDDVVTKRGAPMDSACTGTTLRDLRGTDFSHIPEDVVLPYDNGSVTDGVLVFQPSMLNTPSVRLS